MPCVAPGYTYISVGTPSRSNATCSPSLSGLGTRGSLSATWIVVGVFTCLM
ncbi:hypothetical protein BH11GEM1_BH11GEM1_10880 [soil metagenome]